MFGVGLPELAVIAFVSNRQIWVMNADGSIRALRFVFPPYQVAPYSDGTRKVEVPAQVLLPLVAPEYKQLFRAG